MNQKTESRASKHHGKQNNEQPTTISQQLSTQTMTSSPIPRPLIRGRPIDALTRCIHFHSENDIVAIRFKCCGEYYPCYSCHEETAGHSAQVWPESEWTEKAVLCGACGYEMTIHQYLSCNNQCPSCIALFNPNCSRHYPLYFE